jgi:hypothetical protein
MSGAPHDRFAGLVGFDWDAGNLFKSRQKHGVAPIECEQVFFNRPLVVAADERHSIQERRFYALGRTDQHRLLFVVFAVRRDRVRVISARTMSQKERRIYEKAAQEASEVSE